MGSDIRRMESLKKKQSRRPSMLKRDKTGTNLAKKNFQRKKTHFSLINLVLEPDVPLRSKTNLDLQDAEVGDSPNLDDLLHRPKYSLQ